MEWISGMEWNGSSVLCQAPPAQKAAHLIRIVGIVEGHALQDVRFRPLQGTRWCAAVLREAMGEALASLASRMQLAPVAIVRALAVSSIGPTWPIVGRDPPLVRERPRHAAAVAALLTMVDREMRCSRSFSERGCAAASMCRRCISGWAQSCRLDSSVGNHRRRRAASAPAWCSSRAQAMVGRSAPPPVYPRRRASRHTRLVHRDTTAAASSGCSQRDGSGRLASPPEHRCAEGRDDTTSLRSCSTATNCTWCRARIRAGPLPAPGHSAGDDPVLPTAPPGCGTTAEGRCPARGDGLSSRPAYCRASAASEGQSMLNRPPAA